ncbi:MAG: hypothetical protein MJ231_06470 [bacterium]|nr:hypothetical protein [bacterium]
MIVNRINNINFKENTLSREMNSQDAILMLRDPNAAVRFQQNQEYAQKADSVDSNPIVALGYKLYRTFSMLKTNDGSNAGVKQLDKIA